jgi:hypothetical protein
MGGGYTLAGKFWWSTGPASAPMQYRTYLSVVIKNVFVHDRLTGHIG